MSLYACVFLLNAKPLQVCARLAGFISLAAAVTMVTCSIQKPSESTCASQAEGLKLLPHTAGVHWIEHDADTCQDVAADAALF